METTLYAGIDVASQTLALAVLEHAEQPLAVSEYPNSAAGIKRLISRLRKVKLPVHVCLEPTANYHIAVTERLFAAEGISVSLVNPRAVSAFARSRMVRGKTDQSDARVLAWYGQALKPRTWQPPAESAVQLRLMSRHIEGLVKRETALKNRLRSSRLNHTPQLVLRDIKNEIKQVGRRIAKLREAALELIASDDDLNWRCQQLQSVPGIAQKSATKILAELSVLPAGLGKKQWIAAAGLDPMPRESGTSLRGRRRISRQGSAYLRTALNMPALVAVRNCPPLKEYYLALQRRGLTKLSALCAVMRKLLQLIWGMFQRNELFDETKVAAVRA